MKVALFGISLLFIVTGVSLVIYTEQSREFLKKIYPSDRFWWIALTPIAVGLILVAGAFFYKNIFWLALILGVLALTKGLYLALGPSSQLKALWEWWFIETDDRTIRLFGLISLVLGIAFLSRLN